MPYRQLRQKLGTLVALVGLLVILTLPNRLVWITEQAYLFFPLELIVIGLLLMVPGKAGLGFRVLLALLLGLGVLLRVADLITHEIFARRFNLVFDTHLLADASRLLTGAVGGMATILVGLVLVLVVVLLCWLTLAMLGRIQAVMHGSRSTAALGIAALLAVWGVLDSTGWMRAETYAWGQLVTHGRDTVHSIQDIHTFAETVGEDPIANRPADTLFSRLEGKDVFIVFAESYGRTLLEHEPFIEPVTAKLAWAEETLGQEGLHMRSAFLTAPTVGGLSWLAHASLLSGAWIDSDTRYKSLIVSERITLNRLFRKAGWRTVAAMPAISMAWPEGAYYGYDHIYNAHNFGYEGLPYNWVTMPDQYVWSALHAREREPVERPPLMAELALISSHAPWTPIAELVPWDQVGDGRIFNEQAQAGPTPEQVWSNVDTIRDYYRQTIEYMLETLVSYIQHYGDDDLVLLVLGDHEAAPMVTGVQDARDVPVHLIARDPAIMDAIADWGWQPGLLPDADAPVWRMDRVRDRFIDAFSEPQEEPS